MADEPHVTRPGETVSKDHIKLPMWAWAAIGGITLFFGYRIYKAKQTASSATANTTTGTVTNTGCVDASGNSIACPSYVPVPTATPTGNTPAQESEYENLTNQIAALQGTTNTIGTQSSAQLQGLVPGTVIFVQSVAQPGDTWAKISSRFGSAGGASGLQAANGNKVAPAPNSGIIVPYLVGANDTLDSVAKRFSIAVPHLLLMLQNNQPPGSPYNNGTVFNQGNPQSYAPPSSGTTTLGGGSANGTAIAPYPGQVVTSTY